MKQIHFETHELSNSDEAKAILKGILEYVAPYKSTVWRELTITAKDEQGEIVAGINGFTDWGWLFVKMLWVSESRRGQDLGTQLMKQAETEARARGCHSVWLDTFSFQAKGFYEKLGYTIFGTLENFPSGHQRHFFKKKL